MQESVEDLRQSFLQTIKLSDNERALEINVDLIAKYLADGVVTCDGYQRFQSETCFQKLKRGDYVRFLGIDSKLHTDGAGITYCFARSGLVLGEDYMLLSVPDSSLNTYFEIAAPDGRQPTYGYSYFGSKLKHMSDALALPKGWQQVELEARVFPARVNDLPKGWKKID